MKKETEQEVMKQIQMFICFLAGVGFHDIVFLIQNWLF